MTDNSMSMRAFMLSETYLSQVAGYCSGAMATHVAYHARQMVNEMDAHPELREAFMGGWDTLASYKETSMAWNVAIAHCESIDARLKQAGHRRIYASRWPSQCESLVREFLNAEDHLKAELNQKITVVKSNNRDDNEF